MNIHVVSAGETLSSIAQLYGLTAEWVQRINELPNPDRLLVGQTIIILHPNQVHTVVPGDSPYSIAEKYGIEIRELWRNNPFLTGQESLIPGEQLVINFVENGEKWPAAVVGYAYPYIDRAVLIKTLPYLSYLTIFTYGFTETGELIPTDDDEVIALARRYGTAPVMLISTLTTEGTFSNILAHAILNDLEAQQILINNIIANMQEKNYDALDVDFEYILAEDRQPYIDFIERVTVQCNAAGFQVFTALAPKHAADQPGLLYESHDYRGLGEVSNYVLLMTYEWGYTYGPPMAVAPVNQVRRVLDYAVTEIPREKIFMGVPNYAYDWTLPFVRGESKARSLGNVAAVEQGVKYNVSILFDDRAKTPYYYYTDEEGRAHVVWFEDARSYEAKMNLVAEYEFRGISIWNVMRYFPQGYMTMHSMLQIETIRQPVL